MSSHAPFVLGTVILAAGASSRMGRAKLLLPWGDTTVIGSILRQWAVVGANQIAVVCRENDADLGAGLDRLQHPAKDRIINPDPARGMFSSMQCAAQWSGWSSEVTHWAITLGDQPHLATEAILRLVGAARQTPDRICQPSHNGRARHPILLPRKEFNEVAATRHPTMKEFLMDHGNVVTLVPVQDDGLDFDIDTPEDYQRAIDRFGKSPPTG